MKSRQLRFGLFLMSGLLLLILPLCTYSQDALVLHPHQADPHALRCLTISLIGLGLTVLALVSHYLSRSVHQDTTA